MTGKIKEVFSLFTEKEDFDNVKENIESSIPFKGTNLWVLIFAVFIASLGLNVNSTAVIIGAMLISPLMGPIMGIGFSVAISKPMMLQFSLKNFAFATLTGLATSTLYFLISPLSEAHSEILARTSPNIYDVLIAFFGGCAGMIANGSRLKGNVIPGVAIATALMPPLCTAGFGLATGQWGYFSGALYLYIINTVFIASSTFLVVKILNFPKYHFTESKTEKKWNIIMWFIIVITLVPSIWFGYLMIKKNNFEQNANRFITREATFPNNFLLAKKINFEKNQIELIYGGQKLSEEDFSQLIRKAVKYELIGTKIIVKQGFNFVQNNDKNLELHKPNSLEQDNIRKMIKIQDSITREQKLSKEIFEELRLFDERVSGFSFSNVKIENNLEPANSKVVLVISDEKFSAKQQAAISEFLKIRLKDADLNINFQQREN